MRGSIFGAKDFLETSRSRIGSISISFEPVLTRYIYQTQSWTRVTFLRRSVFPSTPPKTNSHRTLVSRIGSTTTPIWTTLLQPAVHTLSRILPSPKAEEKGASLPGSEKLQRLFRLRLCNPRSLVYTAFYPTKKPSIKGFASRIGVTSTPILTTLFQALCTTARCIVAVQWI